MPRGTDLWLQIAVLGLALYGLLMVASASMGIYTGDNAGLLKVVIKQLIFIVIGYTALVNIANRFTLKFLKSQSLGFLIIAIFFMLLACLVFPAENGARAWIRIGAGGSTLMTIQPSEFAKIVSMMIAAGFLGDVNRKYKNWWELCRKPLIIIACYIGIVAIAQSDMGSAAVIFIITCVCLLVPQHENLKPVQKFLRICFWLSVAFAIFILSPYGEGVIEAIPDSILKPYQKARFLTAIDPFQDPYGNGYQLINGLISFATGGFFGRGYGNSVRKYTDFPEANTDYILAVLIEELGFAGFLVLIALYGILVFRMLYYAIHIKSERAKVILVGGAMYFVVHIFLNIGGVTGMIPLTGVPLLMISSGGSSTLASMMVVGLAQAVISAKKRGEIQ